MMPKGYGKVWVLAALLMGVILVHYSVPVEATPYEDGPIKHIAVLMYENRAFDHFLGFLNRFNPNITGLKGDEHNYIDPYHPSESNKVTVNEHAPYVDPNLSHSVSGTAREVQWGSNTNNVSEALMNGFAADAHRLNNGWGPYALSCFNKTSLPSLSTMALEFGVIDHYFSSIPGPTECNRMYVQSATSDGAADNNHLDIALGYPQQTIYDNLNEAGIDWGVFFLDVPSALVLRHMRQKENLKRFHLMEDFKKMCKAGTLPAYSFLEPAYFHIKDLQKASDQHPSHDVVYGEHLLKNVYGAIRNSPVWNSSVLMVTYDEHGGYYDHIPTPLHVPNPDGKVSSDPLFNFTRLGVRVPAVLASPWIEKGSVLHRPDGPEASSEFEHSSVPATLKKHFGLPNFLTKRDAWAGTFDALWQGRKSPRTDCPEELPTPHEFSPFFEKRSPNEMSSQPMSQLQREFVWLAQALRGENIIKDIQMSEHDAGIFVRTTVREYLNLPL